MNIDYDQAKIDERLLCFLRRYVLRRQSRLARLALFENLRKQPASRETASVTATGRGRASKNSTLPRRAPRYEADLVHEELFKVFQEEGQEAAALEAVQEIFNLGTEQTQSILEKIRGNPRWDGKF